MYLKKRLLLYIVILCIMLFCVIPIVYFTLYFIYKHMIIMNCHNDILHKYGLNSWVVITGASSGIGEKLAMTLASNGFNICIIGSINSIFKLDIIKKKYNVNTYFIEKDFNKSYENNFFDNIETWINNNNVSILINNIGHRVSSLNYINQSRTDIKNTIFCGTLPQSILTQIAIKKFITRHINLKSEIINITSQCFTYNLGLGCLYKPTISVPYLACYEASNAFGYYHSESILQELNIKKRNNSKYKNIGILNITPGAVLTSKTNNSLKWIPFSCTDKVFANNIVKLIGNFEGQQCAYWGHELSNILMILTPFLKKYILEYVGYNIANK